MNVRCPRNGSTIELADGSQPVQCLPCGEALCSGPGETRFYYCPHYRLATDDRTVGEDGADVRARFPGYDVEQVIGQGGSGIVYLAHSEVLEGRVALKVLAAGQWASPKQRLRFQREMSTLAELDLPGVVPILDMGTAADGTPWYAMEYVQGPPLVDLLEPSRPLPEREVARIVLEIARVLQSVHEQGLVHRDIKPSNILLDETGRPFLTDFGLVLDDRASARFTRSTQILGTPRYLAPEQLAGEVEDWRKVDIHGLGLVLAEALTGRLDRGPGGHLDPSPSSRSGASAQLLWVSGRAADPDPARRYDHASDMASDLEAWLAGRRVVPLAWEISQRLPAWLRMRRALLVLTLGAILGLLGIRAFDGWRESREATEREARAQQLLDSTRSEMARLEAVGDLAGADELFEVFAGNPVVQSSRVLLQAWLDRGDEALAAREIPAATRSYGMALVIADGPAPRQAAALGLAEVYRLSGDREHLAALLSRLDSLAPGAAPSIPDTDWTASALYRGDLEGAMRTATPDQATLLGVLGATRPLTAWHAGAWDSDGDGIDELLCVEGADPGAACSPPEVRPGVEWIRLGPRAVVYEREEARTRIWELVPEGMTELHTLLTSHLVCMAELDGRLYAGLSWGRRGLFALEPDGPVPAHGPTHQLDSHVTDLAVGDLDGDGRDEMAGAFCSPYHWGVRVFRTSGDGALEVVAERRWQFTLTADVIQTPEGPRLLVGLRPDAPSKELFPTTTGQETASDFELLALGADGLVLDGRWSLPRNADGTTSTIQDVLACDLDGDGVDEIVAGIESLRGTTDSRATLLQGWRPDGSLGEPLFLDRYLPHQCIQADEDPASELTLSHRIAGAPPTYVLVGSGDDALLAPRHDERSETFDEQLRALGLYREAAYSYEHSGRSGTRADDLLFGARTNRDAGLMDEAMEEARDVLHTRPRAAPQAAEFILRLALERHDPLPILRSLLDDPELLDHLPQEEVRWLEALAAPHLDLTFDEALHPSWQLPWSRGALHDLRSGTLRLRLVKGLGTVVRLPLRRVDGPAWLRIEADWERCEWASFARLSLRPIESRADTDLTLAVYTSGRGGYLERRIYEPSGEAMDWPVGTVAQTTELVATVLTTADGSLRSALRGSPPIDGYSFVGETPLAPAERWELIVEAPPVRAQEPGPLVEWVLERVELGGFEVDETATSAPRSPWQRWADGHAPPPQRGAAAAGSQELACLLRLDPSLGAAIERDLGSGALQESQARLWEGNARFSPNDPVIAASLIALDGEPGHDARWATILAARGHALADAGRPADALIALRDAVELADEIGVEAWTAAFRAEATLADVYLSSGDEERALRHMEAAVDAAIEPELGLRMLRYWPQVAGYEPGPMWEQLVAELTGGP